MTKELKIDGKGNFHRYIEQLLEGQSVTLEELSTEEMQKMFGYLVAKQVDLEGQNDDLRHADRKRKEIEYELQGALDESRQRGELLSALMEGSRAVLRLDEFERSARSIYDSCKRLTGATAGYIALATDDGTENDVIFLDEGEATCLVDPTLAMPIRGLREVVYRTGETIIENDFSNSEWLKYIPTGHAAIDNVLFTPLMVRGIVVGLLGLANKAGGFTEYDASTASAFGELASIALLNSQALESLSSSEEHFRSVAHTANDAIITVNSGGNIVFWNEAATGIFGYKFAEVFGKPLNLIIPERFLAGHKSGIERVVSSGKSDLARKTIEMIGRKKDGQEFPVELSLSCWTSKDETFFTGMIRDISERKLAEEEIRSLARFPGENCNPVLRVSQDGAVLYANEASEPLLAQWNKLVNGDTPERWRRIADTIIRSGESYRTEITFDERTFSLNIVPILDAGYFNIYGRDITERKRAEEEIRGLARFPDENRNPVLRVSLDGTVLYSNDASEPLLALWNSSVNEKIPERWRRLGDTAARSGESQRTEANYDERVFSLDIVPVLDAGYFNIYGRDITERKLAETLLVEQNKFITTVFESLGHPFYVIDASDYTVQMANSAARSGTLPESVRCYSLMHGQDAPCQGPNILCPLEEIKRTRRPVVTEHIHADTGDDTRVFEVHAHPIFDIQGDVTQIIEYTLDIAERKRMEAVLRERTDQLGERVKELNCLYGIAALVEKPDISLPEILQGTVELIPPSWQYPDITGARVILEDQEFRTPGFKETAPWQQTAGITVHGQQMGTVEICYLEQRLESDEGPFLKEERSLINAIAEELGRVVERERAEEALKQAHDDLERRVQERTAQLVLANENLQSEIARRRQAHEAEQKARQIAETLSAASQALTLTLDLDQVLETLLEFLGRLVPYDSGLVFLAEDESNLKVRSVRDQNISIDAQHLLGSTVNIAGNRHIHSLLERQRSIMIADTRQHPNWKAYLGREHVVSWLGVPLIADDKVIGFCGLEKNEPGFFNREHLQLAETFVAQAAVALQNAWLFEQVRAGRERLQSLSRRLVEVQENERRYIARELHDEAGQVLASLMVGLRLLERDADKPEAILAGVAELRNMVDDVLENLHRLAVDLRPASLDHLGLVGALRQYVEDVSSKQGLVAQFEVVGVDTRLPIDIETALYRIVQEAMTNVIRHAQATRVDVLLEQRGDKLVVIVEDNGVGFDPAAARHGDRLGLFGMRERADMLGGELLIECAAEVGTTVFVEVPYVHSHSHSG